MKRILQIIFTAFGIWIIILILLYQIAPKGINPYSSFSILIVSGLISYGIDRMKGK